MGMGWILNCYEEHCYEQYVCLCVYFACMHAVCLFIIVKDPCNVQPDNSTAPSASSFVRAYIMQKNFLCMHIHINVQLAVISVHASVPNYIATIIK